jgi:hypothetical protein
MAERIQRYRVIMEVSPPPPAGLCAHLWFVYHSNLGFFCSKWNESSHPRSRPSSRPKVCRCDPYGPFPFCCAPAIKKRSSPSDRCSPTVPKCLIHGIVCPSRRGAFGTGGTQSQVQGTSGRDEGPLCPRRVIMIKNTLVHCRRARTLSVWPLHFAYSSQSSNISPNSAIRIDSNVSSKFFARRALLAAGTGRSNVSGLRCAMKRKVVSSMSCPTRLHEPLKLSAHRETSGVRCRHRMGLKSNHAPNARQKAVSFSRLRTRSAVLDNQRLGSPQKISLEVTIGMYKGCHSHEITMEGGDVPNENCGDVK